MIFTLKVEGGETSKLKNLKDADWSVGQKTKIVLTVIERKFNPSTSTISNPKCQFTFETETLEEGVYILNELKKRILIMCDRPLANIQATMNGEEIELNGN